MAANESLANIKNFNIADASLTLWSFKKSSAKNRKFKAFSVVTTEDLTAELKRIAVDCLARYQEVEDYQLLVQPNEIGCLYLEGDETSFPELQELIDLPPEEHLITDVNQLENSAGYVVRLQMGGDVLYCVRRLANDWRVKKRASVLNLVLNGNQLDLSGDESFTIAKTFDFFATETDILIVNKANFESLLEYKQTYAVSFVELQQSDDFKAAFSDLGLLVEHVGTNTMHLRRMAVVQERAYYANPQYMQRLRDVSAARQWDLKFDQRGRIVPTEESVRTIIQVLLNHRLHSELSETDFDVPSASPVAG
ncbi:Kiwa anti-phage protein KwaB-like domain-containing protein [Paraburkholderia sediminicola]|uniref:Kiwa anti-phage protein KwaB-like domain-containing protein n=1 Tax=Paraburkholderia sediminicola TaxID=458836 RepID=UPI0038BAD619